MNFAYRESNKKGLNKLGVYIAKVKGRHHMGQKRSLRLSLWALLGFSIFASATFSVRFFGGGPKLNKDGVFKSVSIDFGWVVRHVILFAIVSLRKVTSDLPQQRLILQSADKKLDGVFK